MIGIGLDRPFLQIGPISQAIDEIPLRPRVHQAIVDAIEKLDAAICWLGNRLLS